MLEKDENISQDEALQNSTNDEEKSSSIKKKRKFKLNLLEQKGEIIPSGNITFILAFILPLIMYIALYYIKEIYPFGTNVYLRSDCYHQYAPFFSELWHKIRNGESLWYSWDIGMGTNFTSLFAYYLASPANIIIALFPQKMIPVVMDYLLAVKLSLASVTICYYISKHFNTKKISIVPFGVFYAFSGFLAAFSWNIMWIDCVILLPLIILGLERLVNEDKCIFYCIMLGLCIYTNYYISIMVCISVCLYFICLLVSYKGKKSLLVYLKKVLNFGGFSILAGGLSAILLLPEVYTFSLSASSSTTFPKTWTNYFSIIKEFTRHLINIPVHTALEHHPNIYCGVAVLILLPLYVICKKVRPQEKISKITLLLIFLVSFNLNIPNYIWHGFHYPNSLPARQSFIYIFFCLIICYESFSHISKMTNKEISIAFWISIGFLILVEQLFCQGDDYDFKAVYISGIFILIYGLLIYLKRNTKQKSPILLIIMFATIIIEATINMDETGLGTTSLTSYQSDYEGVKNVTDYANSMDSSFFRTDKVIGARTKNDGAWHNYHSISTFSSTSSAGMSKLYSYLGLESSTNAYGYNGQTLVTNSLFSVKYQISNKILPTSPLLTYVGANNGEFLYKNENVLPIGFMIPENAEESWYPLKSRDGIENTNTLIESLTGISDVFTSTYSYSGDSWVYFSPVKDGHIYLICNNSNCSSIHITINNETTRDFTSIKAGTILDLGYYTTTDSFEIESENSMGLQVYTLESDRYEEAMNKLSNSGLNVTKWSSTSIEGTINASESGNLLFSIPFDKGWSVYIDGRKVTTTSFKDALLMVDLSKGEHTVKLVFTPVNAYLGIVITLISILILIGIYIFNKKRAEKPKKKIAIDNKIEEEFYEELLEEEDFSDEDINDADLKNPDITIDEDAVMDKNSVDDLKKLDGIE